MRICRECGMFIEEAEYHPYAACLMFKSCKDAETVMANLDAVLAHWMEQSDVVVTTNRSGAVVLVSRQNEEGQIQSIIWEAEGPYTAHNDIQI